jgi:DNA polymerase V
VFDRCYSGQMKPRKRSRHGGRRPGAGGVRGLGPFGEATQVVRVPESKMSEVVAFLDQYRRPPRQPAALAEHVGRVSARPRRTLLKVFEAPAAQAGFPSPAADYVEEVLDLNDLLVRNPPSTFLVRIAGDSMIGAGIFPRDYATVDRSITPVPGKIVVAVVNGDFYIKRLGSVNGRPALLSENNERTSELKPIFLDTGQEYEIFGVVTGVIHKL